LQGLVKKAAGNTDYEYDLSRVYKSLGAVEKAQGDATSAAENFRASLVILEKLIQSHSEDPAWTADLDSVKKLLADQQP
jgi:hypothetical protein